ncbi:50S ribosomal protein L11 [Parcubacteria bacterium DG_72]|nr:MAG: 50S ribosomal protein L11 [Parcubacteria bacterium DG_72]
MDREVVAVLRLQLYGGYATPAPPVGPALGQNGVDIGRFCMEFNRRTERQPGKMLPVAITIYKDRSFSFVVKQPTTVCLLKEAAEISKGSGRPNTSKAGFITQEQLNKIAEIKIADLNTSDLQAAARTIAGTARSMGIEIR